MPLTQGRMMAVLAESEAMRLARAELKGAILSAVEAARAEGMDAPEALALIAAIAANAAEPPWQATAVEAYHFRRNAGRNARERRRMQRRRAVGLAVAAMPQMEESELPTARPHAPSPDAITAEEAERAFVSGVVAEKENKS